MWNQWLLRYQNITWCEGAESRSFGCFVATWVEWVKFSVWWSIYFWLSQYLSGCLVAICLVKILRFLWSRVYNTVLGRLCQRIRQSVCCGSLLGYRAIAGIFWLVANVCRLLLAMACLVVIWDWELFRQVMPGTRSAGSAAPPQAVVPTPSPRTSPAAALDGDSSGPADSPPSPRRVAAKRRTKSRGRSKSRARVSLTSSPTSPAKRSSENNGPDVSFYSASDSSKSLPIPRLAQPAGKVPTATKPGLQFSDSDTEVSFDTGAYSLRSRRAKLS